MFQPMPIPKPNPNQNSRTNANPHYHISLRQLQGHSATAAALQIREPQPDRAKLWERKRAGTHRTRVCAGWDGQGRQLSLAVIRARATFPLGKCTAAAPAASLVQIGVDSVDQNLHFERYLLRIRIPKLDCGLRTAIRSVANVDPR